jgi:hypothetical protein
MGSLGSFEGSLLDMEVDSLKNARWIALRVNNFESLNFVIQG